MAVTTCQPIRILQTCPGAHTKADSLLVGSVETGLEVDADRNSYTRRHQKTG